MAVETYSSFSTRVTWRLRCMRAEHDRMGTALRSEEESLALLAEAYARDPEFYRFLRDEETVASLKSNGTPQETSHGR